MKHDFKQIVDEFQQIIGNLQQIVDEFQQIIGELEETRSSLHEITALIFQNNGLIREFTSLRGELDAGLGQCVAEMVAAQIYNHAEGKEVSIVYGSVTSGKLWQFLKLEGSDVTIDINEYSIMPIQKILGILKWMLSQWIVLLSSYECGNVNV